MKKKIIIPIIVLIILVIGISFFVFSGEKIFTTITLDINPSLEINLNSEEKVISVIALNDDANTVINNNLKGKSLDDVLEIIINNTIDKFLIEEEHTDIILYSTGEVSHEKIDSIIKSNFDKKDIAVNIIVINDITDEDKNLAKKYNISPAKVEYLKTIINNHENISIDIIANKSVTELEDTKLLGKYCDSGYTLEGDWCLKEIKRVPAKEGEICPRGYLEYKGKCYEEVDSTEGEKYTCEEGFQLIDDKCISKRTYDAKGKCEVGNYNDGYCVQLEYYGDAKEYCRITPTTDLLMDHKCYGPKPTINGGCLGNDKKINGKCVDMNSYYKADWVCPDGKFITNPDGSLMYEDKKCYKETKTKPSSYYCEDGGTLDGTKCTIEDVLKPLKERFCPDNYTLVNASQCINFNKTVSKEKGFICDDENAKYKNNECIIYERVEAKE